MNPVHTLQSIYLRSFSIFSALQGPVHDGLLAVLPKPYILLCSSHVCPAHFISLHFIMLIFGEEDKSCRCLLYNFLQPHLTFCLLQPDIVLRSILTDRI